MEFLCAQRSAPSQLLPVCRVSSPSGITFYCKEYTFLYVENLSKDLLCAAFSSTGSEIMGVALP